MTVRRKKTAASGVGQSWKVEKLASRHRKLARDLLSTLGLPTDGLEETELWCVKDGGSSPRLLGVAGLETWGQEALLRSVAVDKAHQRSGIGSSLVEHVINEAERRELSELYLITESAPVFFRKLGFMPLARSSVTGDVLSSPEFKGACAETAPVMKLLLNRRR